MTQIVFIATSLDGLIADKEGGLQWLDSVPELSGDDMGFSALMDRIDAIVMGRKTFEKVLSFGCEWPYAKPVFVWSSTLQKVPSELAQKVEIIHGTPDVIAQNLKHKGLNKLYVDGGRTVQSFLQYDLISEMVITVIPVLLGEGIPLFGVLPESLSFKCVKTTLFDNGVVQNCFIRQ